MPPSKSEEENLDTGTMSLMGHIVEFRNRLMISVVTLFIGFICCFAFAEYIFAFLLEPLAVLLREIKGDEARLIYTGMTEVFFSYMKVALFAAAFLTFPIIATQLWMFVAPGLYKNEKRAFLPFLIATPVLFFAGGAMVYLFIFPLAWRFFIGFQTGDVGGVGLAIELEQRVQEYLSLSMKLIFAFGVAFQLPVLLSLLVRVGLTTADSLAQKRKYAVVGIFIFSAVITPPDIISQIGLGVPLILLYEGSILFARMVEKKRAEAES